MNIIKFIPKVGLEQADTGLLVVCIRKNILCIRRFRIKDGCSTWFDLTSEQCLCSSNIAMLLMSLDA